METVTTIAGVRERVRDWHKQGLRVAFVPTMGNLHPGHVSLIEAARAHGDRFIASIFVNPMQLQDEKMRNTAACTTGARCLMIDQVVLKGVVKTTSGMIAMVENSARKQYNLREKDPVYNGFVLKITGDSIVFKESAIDTLGKTNTREVVKRVTVPAV